MAPLCGAVLAYRSLDMKHYDPARKTIADFGEQWTTYVDNEGRYGSREYFFDIVSPLLTPEEVNDASVADIGSGTGRIVLMLIDAGARIVHAVEPSNALEVVKQNTKSFADRIVYHHARGDELPSGLDLDLVVSIGVIHHIPEPQPVMRAAFNALRPGGRCVVWLYGHEGNETYLAIFEPLRRITARLPHWILAGLSHLLNIVASGYAWLCRWVKLPLADYMRRVFSTLSWHKRFLVIYDQLNPAYAKYYTCEEARALFVEAGFVDVTLHHRHGYSWTVAGRKP